MYENQTRAACVLTTCKQPKGHAPKHDREVGSLGWPVNADMYFRLLFFLAKKQPETQCISASATCYSEDWHSA